MEPNVSLEGAIRSLDSFFRENIYDGCSFPQRHVPHKYLFDVLQGWGAYLPFSDPLPFCIGCMMCSFERFWYEFGSFP